MFDATTRASCIICYGSREAHGSECSSCKEVEPALVRSVLAMLSPKHMALLRRFEHTLAYQPVTEAEYNDALDALSVDDDEAEVEGYEIAIPATRHWIASGAAHSPAGETGFSYAIKYSPLGLALRECVMAGASARVRA